MSSRSSKIFDLGSTSVREKLKQDREAREGSLMGIPARITKITNYESRQTVDVEYVIRDIYKDGRELAVAQIRDVFVQLTGGGDFSVCYPVKVGDLVTLHYVHRSIDTFLDGDGSNVAQPREFTPQMRDCYVTLGFGTRKNNYAPSTTDLIVRTPEATITITPAGDITAVTSGSIVAEAGVSATVKAPTISLDGNVTITGTLDVQDATTLTTNVTSAGVNIGSTHIHTTPSGPSGVPM